MHLKLSNDFVNTEQLIGPLPNFDGKFETFFIPKAFQSLLSKSLVTSDEQLDTIYISIQNENDLIWFNEIELAKDSRQQNIEIIYNFKQIYFKATRRLAKNELLYAFPSKDLEIALGLQYVPQSADRNYFCKKCMLNLNHQFDLMLHMRYFCSSLANSNVNPARIKNFSDTRDFASTNKRKMTNEILGINKKLKEPLATNLVQSDYEIGKQEVLANQFRIPLNSSTISPYAYLNTIQTFLNNYNSLPYLTNQIYHQKFSENIRNSEFSALISAYLQSVAKSDQKVHGPIDLTIRKPHLDQGSLYRVPFLNSSISSNSSEKSSSSLENLHENLQQSNSLSASNGKKTQLAYEKASLQNWCAKCNTYFRLTSDLVYHMRTFHKKTESNNCELKSELNKTELYFGDKGSIVTSNIANKELKGLRCDICKEFFKEKHHLTRHMTSHR